MPNCPLVGPGRFVDYLCAMIENGQYEPQGIVREARTVPIPGQSEYYPRIPLRDREHTRAIL